MTSSPLRLALLGGAAATALLGCVPDRDNRFDPASAPVARVKVVGAPQPCAAGGTQSPEYSRGWCLTVDASESSDPQGTDGLTYSFSVIAPPAAVRDLAVDITSPLLPLDGPTRRSMLLDTAMEIQVVVRDGSGATGSGSTVVTLRNAEPIAAVGPTRALPEGGFPWAPGVAFDVFFDGTASFDPDGDPLTYCWTFADGEVCSADVRDPAFTRSLPTTREQHIGFLRVHDNPEIATPPFRLTSRPDVSTVSVREPNVWTVKGGASAVVRIDSARDVLYDLSDGAQGAFMSRASGDAVGILYQFGGAANLSTAPFPAAFPLSAPLVLPGDEAVNLVYAPTTDVLWALTAVSGPVCSGTLSRVTLTGAPALGSGIPVPNATCGAFPTFLDLDLEGNVWISDNFGPTLTRVSAAGGSADVDIAAGRIFTGIDDRPGSSEVWIVEMADVLAGGGTQSDALLRRYTSFTSDTYQSIPLGVSSATAIGWISETEFWLSVPGDGVRLVDAELLLSGAGITLDEATIAFAPVLDALLMVTDLNTGVCWATPASGSGYRIARDGSLLVTDATSFAPELVDPEGALWFSGNQGLLRGFTPAIHGEVTSVDLFTFGGAEYDLQTGGVWIPTVLPPAIVHAAEDGTVLEIVSGVDRDGSSELIALPVNVRISPDGRAAYVFGLNFNTETGTGVDRIDLGVVGPTGLPRITKILDAAYADDLEATASSTLEASAPVPSSTPFLWAVRNAAAPMVVTISTAGTPISTRFNFPAAEYTPSFDIEVARSLRTNRLCVATVDATNNLIRVRSVPVTGTVVQLGTMPRPTNMELIGVSATEDPAMCWVAYTEFNGANPIGHIRGWSTAGAPFRSHDEIDSNLESFFAVNADSIWFTVRKESNQANGQFKVRLDRWNAGTGTYLRRQELQPKGDTQVIAPNSSQESGF